MKKFLLMLICALTFGTFLMSNVHAEDTYCVNIIILGEAGSGKTLLRNALANVPPEDDYMIRKFTTKTNVKLYDKEINGGKYRFLYWDTVGVDKKQTALMKHCDKMRGLFIIVLDLYHFHLKLEMSFGNYDALINEFNARYRDQIFTRFKKAKLPAPIVLIVGTKLDSVEDLPDFDTFISELKESFGEKNFYVVSVKQYSACLSEILNKAGALKEAREQHEKIDAENSIVNIESIKEHSGIPALQNRIEQLTKGGVVPIIKSHVKQEEFVRFMQTSDVLKWYE